jgi:hypothetical protein
MNWLLEVSRASLGAEISLTAALQALLRESAVWLSAVFAEKPLLSFDLIQFVLPTHKFLRLLAIDKLGEPTKVISRFDGLSHKFSRQHLIVFLDLIHGRAKEKHVVF